jgi:hypothetical protein
MQQIPDFQLCLSEIYFLTFDFRLSVLHFFPPPYSSLKKYLNAAEMAAAALCLRFASTTGQYLYTTSHIVYVM